MPDLGMWAGTATGWLLTYLAHSTVIVTAVWVVGRVRPWAPETRDLLWKVALFAGVASAAGATLGDRMATGELEVVTRVEGRALHGDRADLDAAPPEVTTWVADFRAPGYFRVDAEAAAPSAACGEVLRAKSPDSAGWLDRVVQACGQRASLAWYHYVLIVWLAGALLGSVRLLQGRRSLRRLRDGLDPAPVRVTEALRQVAGSRRRVEVGIATTFDAPCVVDGRTIAVPKRCADDLTDPELKAVLAHEMAHVERRDVWWLAAARAVCAMLWLQPLNRLAMRGMIEAAELVCDDRAVATTREPLCLASSISRVAEWAVEPRLSVPVVAMAGGDRRSLSTRVERILSGQATGDRGRWRRMLGGVCLLVPMTLLPAIPGPTTLRAAFFIDRGGESETVLLERMDGPGVVGERRVRLRLEDDSGGQEALEGHFSIVARPYRAEATRDGS